MIFQTSIIMFRVNLQGCTHVVNILVSIFGCFFHVLFDVCFTGFFRAKHIRHMLPPVHYIHIGSKQIYFWNQGFKAALPKTSRLEDALEVVAATIFSTNGGNSI